VPNTGTLFSRRGKVLKRKKGIAIIKVPKNCTEEKEGGGGGG